uniref:Uncharacterized protein n=1 Tax=Cannabis sativa TaxID=3483 RepID=A0A803PRI9_CANSA
MAPRHQCVCLSPAAIIMIGPPDAAGGRMVGPRCERFDHKELPQYSPLDGDVKVEWSRLRASHPAVFWTYTPPATSRGDLL